MSWWKGSTRTGKSALNRTFLPLRPYPREAIGSNLRRQHFKLLPAVEVAAPITLGRAKDEVVELVAELDAIPWLSRTRDTNNGIEREALKLLMGSFWPRRKPARCWSFNGSGWCRISDASQRRKTGRFIRRSSVVHAHLELWKE
eukprot:3202291-Pleurochrysis_carterae.AAC.1